MRHESSEQAGLVLIPKPGRPRPWAVDESALGMSPACGAQHKVPRAVRVGLHREISLTVRTRFPRLVLPWAGLAILWSLALHAGAPENTAPGNGGPSSLLLITIDTWRWDYIGIAGTKKVETPALDRLAASGVYEAEAVTPCPLTTPAHASLFTGLLPVHHGILDCTRYSLRAGIPTLAELFKAAGYRTAAFVSAEPVARRYGLDRGFDHYDDSGQGKRGELDPLQATRAGEKTTEAALAFLRKAGPAEPLFLWIHYFDLHTPYRKRAPYDARYPGNLYAAEAAFVDDQVAHLAGFCGAERGRSWRIVVAGDHGEGRGDHGEGGHGIGLYRSTLHVPLILYPKPDRPLEHPKPWGLADLTPTLCDWFGLHCPKGLDGESLFARGTPNRTIPCLSMLPAFIFNVNPVLGVRKGRHVYLRCGEEEMYDLAADPDQTHPLAAGGPNRGLLADLRRACDAAFPPSILQPLLMPSIRSTPEEMERLRGLGYIEGGVPGLASLQKASLNDILADYEGVQDARDAAFTSGDWTILRRKYEGLIQKHPGALNLQKNLGKVCLTLQDFPAAFAAFKKVLVADPKDPEGLLNMGALYIAGRDARRAEFLLKEALKIRQDDPAVYKNLGILYETLLQRPDLAVPNYKRYLDLEPRSPDREKILTYIRSHEHKGPETAPVPGGSDEK